MTDAQVQLLGSVAVLADGQRRALGGPRQRALLATLGLSPNEVVSVDRIVDSVWGAAAPPSARHISQTYVSQLRLALEGVAKLRTESPGYILEIEREALDAARFEWLVREARAAAEPARWTALLDEALALWRGAVAEDVPLEGDARIAAQRLGQLRLEAVELRIDGLLELGRHREVVHDIEQLVAQEPLRERFRLQLMLALYRSGRQSDALASYRDARRYLADELGLDPSPELRELERRILQHDPSLASPAADEPAGSSVRRRRRPAAIAAICATAAVIAVAAVVIAASGGASAKLRPLDAAMLDGRTGRILSTPVRGTAAAAIAAAGSRAWVATSRPRGLVALAPSGRSRTLRLGLPPYSLAASGGVVWIAPGYQGTLQRVSGGRATQPFRPAPSSRGRTLLAGTSRALWVASQDGYLRRLDPSSERVTAAVRVGLPNAIAAGLGSIWVASAAANQIVRVDAASGHVQARINIGGIPTSVVAGPGGIWAATPASGNVWRISPRLNAVLASVSPLVQPSQVAAAGGHVWVASGSTGALVALDGTGDVIRRIELPTPVARLAGDGDRLWLTLKAAD